MDRDVRKSEDLFRKGYRVVRIREQSGHALPLLGINSPDYLELTYDYSPDWSGLSDVVDQITTWITDLTSRSACGKIVDHAQPQGD